MLQDKFLILSSAITQYRTRFTDIIPIALLCSAGKLFLDSVFADQEIVSFITGFHVELFCLVAIELIVIDTEKKTSSAQAIVKTLPIIVSYYLLFVFGALAVLGGMLILILPGIYLALVLSVSKYSLLCKNYHGMQALLHSWSLIAQYPLEVLLRIILLILFAFSSYAFITLFSDWIIIDLLSQSTLYAKATAQFFNMLLIAPITSYYLFMTFSELLLTGTPEKIEIDIKRRNLILGACVLSILAIMYYISLN
ncbi:MAG: hypothetical protein QM538_03695 [Methylacidiphilales bacterium]|nr:hypothetical protein [Candidatus Methylacidiphilales bacterium]